MLIRCEAKEPERLLFIHSKLGEANLGSRPRGRQEGFSSSLASMNQTCGVLEDGKNAFFWAPDAPSERLPGAPVCAGADGNVEY